MKKIIIFSAVALFFTACSKNSDDIKPQPAPPSPTVTTPSVTTGSFGTITQTSVIVSNNTVPSDGGATVTEKGVVYSLNPQPTESDIKLSYTGGGGTGSYTMTITGLQHSTKYYVRAYAVNSKGTAYGSESNFTTSVPLAKYSIGQVLPSGAIVWKLLNAAGDSARFIWRLSPTEGVKFGGRGTYHPGTVNTLGAGPANTNILSAIADGIGLTAKNASCWIPTAPELKEVWDIRLSIPAIQTYMDNSNGMYWTSKEEDAFSAIAFSWPGATSGPFDKQIDNPAPGSPVTVPALVVFGTAK